MQRDDHVHLSMVLQAIVIYSHIDLDYSEALVALKTSWQSQFSDMAVVTSDVLLQSDEMKQFKYALEQKPVIPTEMNNKTQQET